MSIGIYAFLRIYFLGFCVSVFAQFRTHCADSPVPPPSRSARHALRCGLGCAVRPGALGAGVSTGGVYRERRGWGRSCPLIPKQIKKAFSLPTHPTFTNPNPSDCASLQKFRKIQKDPSPGLICVILDRKKGAL